MFFLQAFVWGSIGHAQIVSCAPALSVSRDKYANYSELARNEIKGRDFQIVTNHRGSVVTIIAPHAGLIEFGTSEIARELAGNSFNLYLFEGIKAKDNFSLHVTSPNFDEPQAVKIMTASGLGISIHGYKDDSIEAVSIGGMNTSVASSIALALRRAGIIVEFPSIKFKGDTPDNIVNKASQHGVQLEISSKLRRSLVSNPQKLHSLTEAIRSAL